MLFSTYLIHEVFSLGRTILSAHFSTDLLMKKYAYSEVKSIQNCTFSQKVNSDPRSMLSRATEGQLGYPPRSQFHSAHLRFRAKSALCVCPIDLANIGHALI